MYTDIEIIEISQIQGTKENKNEHITSSLVSEQTDTEI